MGTTRRPLGLVGSRSPRGARSDWPTIDPKLRSSIIEGLSVFLLVFDLLDVARTFCPPKFAAAPPRRAARRHRRRRTPAPAARQGDRRGLRPRAERAGGNEPAPVARRRGARKQRGSRRCRDVRRRCKPLLQRRKTRGTLVVDQPSEVLADAAGNSAERRGADCVAGGG